MPKLGETRDQLLQQIEAIRVRLKQLDGVELERGADARQRTVAFQETPSHVAPDSSCSVKQHCEDSQWAVIEWDADFVMSRWSRQAEVIFGWRADEVLGKRLDQLRFIHNADREIVKAFEIELVERKVDFHSWSIDNYCKSGEVVNCEWFHSAIRDKQGRVKSWLSLAQDVTTQARSDTERQSRALDNLDLGIENREVLASGDMTELQQTQGSLIESEARFRALVDNSFDVVNLFSATGELLYASPSIERVLGFLPEEMKKLPPTEVIHPDDFERADEGFRSCLDTPRAVKRYALRLRHKEGSYRTVEITGTNLLDEPGVHAMLSVFRDVTGLKRAEDALRQLNSELEQRVTQRTAELSEAMTRLERSEQRLAAILDNTSFLIGLCEADGMLLLANRAVQRNLGFPESQWVGRTLWEGPGWPSEEVRAEIRDMLIQASAGSFCRREILHQRSDGSTAIFDFSISPIRDEQGNIVMLVPEGHDISKLKLIEGELQEKNEELQAFAHTVSHDLRAPVRAMEGFATALMEDFGERLDETGRGYVRRILRSAQRMDSLIEDLLAYGRLSRADLQLRDISLNDVVSEAMEHLVREVANCGARIDAAPNLQAARGHRATLVQIVVNLVSNAVKFVARGVRPEVRIWSELRHNNCVRLWVEDNGIGIAATDHDRIFRSFQRLHGIESYAGNGIGLAVVARGCNRLGASHGVESELGRGSRFWIELPKSSITL